MLVTYVNKLTRVHYIYCFQVTYRRDRGVREVYEDRFVPERQVSVFAAALS